MRLADVHLIEKIVTATVILTVLAMAGILFFFLSLRLGEVTKENQAYNRYTACVLSVPPSDRDIKKIDYCWGKAQKDTGVKVIRYDGRQ